MNLSDIVFNIVCCVDDSPTHTFLDVAYDLRCQSDPLRITKNSRVFGMACDPVGEMGITMVMNDSRILLWDLKIIDYQVLTH